MILLDNQSSCHLFKNWNLLTNVRKASHAIAIHSTAGVSSTDMVGNIPNFPDPVWLYKDRIANILSFSKIKEAGFEAKSDSYDGRVPTSGSNEDDIGKKAQCSQRRLRDACAQMGQNNVNRRKKVK